MNSCAPPSQSHFAPSTPPQPTSSVPSSPPQQPHAIRTYHSRPSEPQQLQHQYLPQHQNYDHLQNPHQNQPQLHQPPLPPTSLMQPPPYRPNTHSSLRLSGPSQLRSLSLPAASTTAVSPPLTATVSASTNNNYNKNNINTTAINTSTNINNSLINNDINDNNISNHHHLHQHHHDNQNNHPSITTPSPSTTPPPTSTALNSDAVATVARTSLPPPPPPHPTHHRAPLYDISKLLTAGCTVVSGKVYSDKGHNICGVLNQHDKPCKRIGKCPFHINPAPVSSSTSCNGFVDIDGNVNVTIPFSPPRVTHDQQQQRQHYTSQSLSLHQSISHSQSHSQQHPSHYQEQTPDTRKYRSHQSSQHHHHHANNNHYSHQHGDLNNNDHSNNTNNINHTDRHDHQQQHTQVHEQEHQHPNSNSPGGSSSTTLLGGGGGGGGSTTLASNNSQTYAYPPKKMQYKHGWSKEEHYKFLKGLDMYSRGSWKQISMYVKTRTPTQVQSHAQKYFLRQRQGNKKKCSIHDLNLHSPEMKEFENKYSTCNPVSNNNIVGHVDSVDHLPSPQHQRNTNHSPGPNNNTSYFCQTQSYHHGLGESLMHDTAEHDSLMFRARATADALGRQQQQQQQQQQQHEPNQVNQSQQYHEKHQAQHHPEQHQTHQQQQHHHEHHHRGQQHNDGQHANHHENSTSGIGISAIGSTSSLDRLRHQQLPHEQLTPRPFLHGNTNDASCGMRAPASGMKLETGIGLMSEDLRTNNLSSAALRQQDDYSNNNHHNHQHQHFSLGDREVGKQPNNDHLHRHHQHHHHHQEQHQQNGLVNFVSGGFMSSGQGTVAGVEDQHSGAGEIQVRSGGNGEGVSVGVGIAGLRAVQQNTFSSGGDGVGGTGISGPGALYSTRNSC